MPAVSDNPNSAQGGSPNAPRNTSQPPTSNAAGKDSSPVSLLKSESFAICPDGSQQSGLNLIADDKSWQLFVDSAHQRAPGLAQWKPNFSSSQMVVVRMGTRSSAGYEIKAVEARLKSGGNELELIVTTSKPAADSLSASVLTSPCLLATIASTTFASLTVFDQTENRLIGQITR